MTTSQQWEYFDRSRRAEVRGEIPTGGHSYDRREREGLEAVWKREGRTPLGVGEEEEDIGVGGGSSSVGGRAGVGMGTRGSNYPTGMGYTGGTVFGATGSTGNTGDRGGRRCV